MRRHIVGEDLDGDAAPKLRVTRAVDLAHTAGAERRNDLVRAEAGTCDQGHRETLILARSGSCPAAVGISSLDLDTQACERTGDLVDLVRER